MRTCALVRGSAFKSGAADVPLAVAPLRPTKAPSARAAREKQTVSGVGEHEAPFAHADSPLRIVRGPRAAYVR